MKILISVDGYPYPGLPYSAFISVLAHELVRQGCDVMILAPQSLTNHWIRRTPLVPRYYTDEVDTTKVIPVYRPYTLTFGNGILSRFSDWITKQVIKRTIKFNHITPDIYYAHFWHSAFHTIATAKSQGKPLFVATGEDIINVSRHFTDNEIASIKEYTKGVICVSTKNKNESIKLGLTDEERCIVIPNSIDPTEFYIENRQMCRAKLGIHDNDFVVAFCGRFNHRKGVYRIDEAINLLQDPSIKTIFIGNPKDGSNKIPGENHSIFVGQLAHDQIVHYLNAADVFVLPSLAEGCPNSVIEAMACGLPIISSDMDFNYDILDADSAILVDPYNIKEIAEAIAKIKNDDCLREQLKKESIRNASRLTIDQRASHILGYLRNK